MDIGKKVHYGYFRTPKNQDVKPFPFYNSGQSFNKIWKKLCRFKEKHMLNEVVIGFESTGPYAEPIANYLRKKPVKLVQVNPRLPESLYSLFQLNWRRTNFNTI